MTTVVTLQSEVDDNARSFRVTSLATVHREVKVAVIAAFSVTERILLMFVREVMTNNKRGRARAANYPD